jgi:glutathione S-transferase
MPQLSNHLDFLGNELCKAAWFVGNEFTAAAVQMSFPIEAAAARAGLDANRG